MMGRAPKARSAMACKACHAQKLKCNGGTPCERCLTRRRECVYPVREKLVTVSECYLRRLEREHSLKQGSGALLSTSQSGSGLGLESDQAEVSDCVPLASSPKDSQVVKEEDLEDCSAECFVKRLKLLSWTAASSNADSESHETASCAESYTYSRLKFDFMPELDVSFRLPPRPYAFLLLQAFEEGFSEYHWFLRKGFRDRLILTYSDPRSQSHDRSWLCRVSVVLALAESFNRSRMTSATYLELTGQQPPNPYMPPSMPLATNSPSLSSSCSSSSPSLPPGSDLFEQGLMLLKMSPEEPVPEDVEALNLVAYYCYSLNRRKTAYSYASQSVALAKLLQLNRPCTIHKPGCQEMNFRLVNEHRKRLWWTSYCMDRMISTELGVAPALASVPEGTKLPTSAGLTPEEMQEFSDPDLLTASTQLCEIKRCVVRAAARHSEVDDGKWLDIIKPCVDMLHEWMASLPGAMTFTFEDSLPTRLMEAQRGRILASIYLRYHQCFILLLRPLYLQKLSSLVQKRRLSVTQQPDDEGFDGLPLNDHEAMRNAKVQCLQAARNNCKILLALWNYNKIAKFGYWESLHLFSGLAILVLARVSIEREKDLSHSTEENDDAALYASTRALLREMARVGNPAASDHDTLLSDVEAMVERVEEEERISRRVDAEMESGEASMGFSDFTFADMGGEPIQQIWSDADWENILSAYSQGI